MNIDGGIITTARLSFSSQTHPPSIFTLALSLRRSRDFSQSLLRRSSPTARDLGVFCYAFIMRSLCVHYAVVMLSLCCGYAVIMLWLCCGYAVIMLWLGGGAPHWFIERSSRRWGAHPPPSIRQSIYKLVPKQQRSDHFTLTYFICIVMRLNCPMFILGLNGGIDT